MEEFVMFDTCVWEKFVLSQEKKIKQSPLIPKDLETCKKIIEIIESKKIQFKIYTSDFNILELRDQLWKLFCDRTLYEYGYLPTEFYDGRKVLIKQYDKEIIKTIKEKLEGLFVISDEHFTYPINSAFVTNHCEQGITCFDAILVDQARQKNCKYFVTTDGTLRSHFYKKIDCEIIKANTFLSKIN